MKPIIEQVFMVDGSRITVLPVIRRTPKGVVYLKYGTIETAVRPSAHVYLFGTGSEAAAFVRQQHEKEIAGLERRLEQLRKRARVDSVDWSHVMEARAEARDPGQARRKTDHLVKNLKL